MSAAPADLDRVDIAASDPSGMLATVMGSADHWARGLELALAAPPPPRQHVRVAVVCGMGGSGIAGDVAMTSGDAEGRVPILVNKTPRLPAVARAGALVVAVSYSGDTAETLAAFEEATAAGVARIAVTSGGALARRATETGATLVTVPGGWMPRAAVAYLSAGVLIALERASVLVGAAAGLAAAPTAVAGALAAYGPEVASTANEVKQLASAIGDSIPLFVGSHGWPALVAARGKTQVHENSKRVAFSSELPELDHNEIVGLASERRPVTVVAVRDAAAATTDGGRTVDATLALLRDRLVDVRELTLPDGPGLARFAAGVAAVDLLSLYLAIRGGVDPTPIEPITALKEALASSTGG